MDRALLVLDQAKKIKTNALWRPDLYYLAIRHVVPMPPHLVIDIKKLKFDSHTVNHILPFLDGDVFDEYMKFIGAFLWKTAEQEHLTDTEAKQVVLAVLQRRSLEHLLMAYLTLWEDDRDHFPHHLYSLGLGRQLRLTHRNLDSKMLYYRQKSPNSFIFVNPIFPTLRHTHTYAFNPDNFIAVTEHIEKNPLLPQLQIPAENLFYIKMTFISVRINQHRWSEAFAQGLSAMDLFHHSYDCYHDLMCFVALSAGKMSLSESLVFRVLEEARTFAHEMEHDWHRILVLHSLCIHWGYFELEQDIYNYSYNMIGARTEYHYKLVRQHMESLMRQCENIDMFLKTRRKYHAQCAKNKQPPYCTLTIIFDYSFLKMDELLREMESLLSDMVLPGEKEYYLAIIHHYKTHKATQDVDTIDIFHRQIASKYFSIASKLLKPGDGRILSCALLHKASEHGADPDHIMKSMENVQISKNTPEIADLWVQVALLNMSFNNSNFMGGGRILQHMLDTYRRATHNNGYRKYILQAAYGLQKDEGFVHAFHPNVPDFPDAHDCFSREERQGILAKWFWKQETDKFARSFQLQLDEYDVTEANQILIRCVTEPPSTVSTSSSSGAPPPEQAEVVIPPPSTFQDNDVIVSHTLENNNNDEGQEEEEDEEEEEEDQDFDDEDEDQETVSTEVDNNSEAEAVEATHSHNNIQSLAEFVQALPLPVQTRPPLGLVPEELQQQQQMDLPPPAPPSSPILDLRAGSSQDDQPNPAKKRRIGPCVEELLTARDLLELDPLAEEVYAFGCHLIKLMAE